MATAGQKHMHGRDHRQVGQDPISDPDVIYYRVHNTGEWLDITTTGVDPDAGTIDPGRGFKVYSSNGILLENSDATTTPDGQIALLIGTLSLLLLTKASLTFQTQSMLFKFITGLGAASTKFAISSSNSHGDITLYDLTDGGVTTWRFYDASSKLEVKDHSGSVIFRVADDGTVTAAGSITGAVLDGGGP